MFINKTKAVDTSLDMCAITHSMADQLPFNASEAINHLCINIMAHKTNDTQILAVTSAEFGEGKTFVATAMARNLAKINYNSKVLFIDADLRSANGLSYVEKTYGENIGLSEYLANKTDEINFINTDLENFNILSAGSKSENPMTLLASPKLKDVMDACKEKYTYIVIDASPVGVVKDALLLARYIDGYIISVKAGKSRINKINDVIDAIKGVNGNVIGTVLDFVDLKK